MYTIINAKTSPQIPRYFGNDIRINVHKQANSSFIKPNQCLIKTKENCLPHRRFSMGTQSVDILCRLLSHHQAILFILHAPSPGRLSQSRPHRVRPHRPRPHRSRLHPPRP